MVEPDAKNFAIRLNQALDLRGYPAIGNGRINYIQEVFQLSRAGANKWIHGKSIPHPNARRKIAEKLGISIVWLETGNGSPTQIDQSIFSSHHAVAKIPLMSLTELYAIDDLRAYLAKVIDREMIIVNNTVSRNSFAVKHVGNAMIPKFYDGNLLIVDTEQAVEDGDYVIAKSVSIPEAILRQLIIGDSGSYLVALNPKFEPITLEKKNQIIGKVIETRMAV